MSSKRLFIETMAKHLPPSAAQLRLLDIGAETGAILQSLRPDLLVIPESIRAQDWRSTTSSVDAVAGYDLLLTDELLARVLDVMRPGGRMIILNPAGTVDEAAVRHLERAGFIRILVEPAAGTQGVLIRGEREHLTADTHARIQSVARRDPDQPASDIPGSRFVHLLIRQIPNKPVWKLQIGEQIVWKAVGIQQGETAALLAFSSLPRAVAFMQTSILAGTVQDVNKVVKFEREIVSAWQIPVLMNPEPELTGQFLLVEWDIDPAVAATPDE